MIDTQTHKIFVPDLVFNVRKFQSKAVWRTEREYGKTNTSTYPRQCGCVEVCFEISVHAIVHMDQHGSRRHKQSRGWVRGGQIDLYHRQEKIRYNLYLIWESLMRCKQVTSHITSQIRYDLATTKGARPVDH